MSGVEVVLFDSLDAVARDAGTRLDRAAQPCLFDRLDWWRLTAEHIPAIRPLIVRARCGDAWMWLPLSQGRKLTPLASWYTLAFAPVFSAAQGLEALLLAAAADRLRACAHELVVWPLRGTSANDMIAALESARWRTRLTETSANWRSGPIVDWQTYWDARPSRLRNTVTRKQRGSKLRFRVADAVTPALWRSFTEVFAASWKGPEGSPKFLEAFARAEAAAGTLRLTFADAEGVPIAAQSWTVEGGTATLHKLAHCADQRQQSPGTLLTARTIERLITVDHVHTLDFGTGDDAYKRDWADQRAPLFTLEAADARSARGLMRIARWRLRVLADRLKLP